MRIPNTINDDKLEDTIIEACKDVNIDVSETDIEACHRLPVKICEPETCRIYSDKNVYPELYGFF